jgi:hypothetical protein
MMYFGQLALVILFTTISACSSESPVSGSFFPEPNVADISEKDVLISMGSLKGPYSVLGPVEYILRQNPSYFQNSHDLSDLAMTHLKHEALAKYGERVDAIMNTQFHHSVESGYDGQMEVIHIEGTAIEFKTPKKKILKPKSKAKPKIIARKPVPTKPNVAPKIESEPDINITPEELLK